MSLQWRVTVTDQHGQEHVFVIVAGGENEIAAKVKDYMRKQCPPGTRIAKLAAELERRNA